MSFLHSSQGFVKALKAPSDPPIPGGPLKLAIARRAWDDTSFHVPNKSEVIVDWVLNKFLKEKYSEPPQTPFLDPQYWELLYDVLSSTDVFIPGVTSRPLKTWLPTLLNRTPLAPILSRFLNLLDNVEFDLQIRLSETFSSCFRTMWPLAVRKIGTETLLECFGALLKSTSLCERNKGIGRVGGMIAASYRSSLWNYTNKKKIYLTFLETHLYSWLECSTIKAQSNSHRVLLEAAYEAGIDTILNVDILRQARDSESENMLFEAIAAASLPNSAILAVLPRIFASYIQVVKKHRGALFGQDSKQLPGVLTEESNAYGMKFFVAFNSLLDCAGPDSTTWSTRVLLLSLVDQENIYTRGRLDLLNPLVGLALSTLEDLQNDQKRSMVFSTYAMDSLLALARIDYNIISPVLPRILSAILVHESSSAYLEFLDWLLSYHTKTRTMDTYVTTLFSALSPPRKFTALGSAPVVYQQCHSGPLMDSGHLDSLSRGISGFLSGIQLSALVNFVAKLLSQTLQQLYDSKEISDSNDDLPPKSTRESTSISENLIIGTSLLARLSSTVMSSLSLGSIPNDARQKIFQTLNNIRNTLVPRVLTKSLRCLRKTGEASDWEFQVAAMALLRLRYALDTSRHLSFDQSEDLKLLSTIEAALKLDRLMPELRVEIFRTLLSSSGLRGLTKTQGVIGHVVTYLDENLRTPHVQWSENLHQLSSEGTAGVLAILHMVTERWLSTIETVASPLQLMSFLRCIIHSHFQESPIFDVPGSNKSSLFAQIFQSAQFWEHPNIRSAMLGIISDATSILDNTNNALKLSSVIPMYRMLLLFPLEYIPRSYRTEIIRKAIAADLFIIRSSEGSNYAMDDTVQNLIILRVFLNRTFLHGGFTEQSVHKICELSRSIMMRGDISMHDNSEFSSATTNLMGSLLSELLFRSTMSNPDAISTITTFLEMIQNSTLEGTDTLYPFVIRMSKILEENFFLTNFPQEFRALLHDFYRRFSLSFLPRIQGLFNTGISGESLDPQSNALKLWCALLVFGQWLGLTENPLPRLGKELLMNIPKISPKQHPSPEAWSTLLVTVLAILLKEVHYLEETDCLAHLSLTVASYLSFSAILGVDYQKRLGDSVSQVCRTLPSPHFTYILDLVGEGLTTLTTSEDELTQLIEFSVLSLHNHPQGTLKVAQIHATGCLSTFIERSIFTEGSVLLRVQVLEFVVRHCSDRPAVLRLGDVNNIWALIARFLSGSRVHDDKTTSSIFHKIVMIISALVRFRRDLVVLTLPHLGIVLCQLLMSIRSVRPLLGSRQTTLVADTLPKWVNSRTPLGVEEGRILARLLETLANKSVLRSNAAVSETQKAESLAKPFSKHASYVLKAYIEAVNDPLCILHSDLRKELQRGLYVLCNMVSDHNRDAIMLSALDSGGRTTMKVLWKEYEKQKYIGKG